jgi:hypothetical protein
MPSLIISNEFSHMGGREFLFQKYPKLSEEIKHIITTVKIPPQFVISDESTRKGKKQWSGKNFNPPLEKSFNDHEWYKIRLKLEYGYVETDFYKERVAIEIQFGKYFSVDTDFSKFEIFHHMGKLDVGVEILPSLELQKDMCTGPPSYDQVIARIKAKGRNNPAVPLWVIGVDCR